MVDFAESPKMPRLVAPDLPEAKGSPTETAFAPPPGTEWSRLDPAFTRYRRLLTALVTLPVAVLGGTGAGLWLHWAVGGAVAALALLGTGVAWATAERTRLSWGYAEGESDFYLTFGTVIRQLLVIPYGRMQVVDITANLLEQALGIATIRVRTAASTADARVPGLRLADAAALRDRLTERGETFPTGL
jgi:membrane protein YdbS with pleckstrin-like domain